MAKVSKGNTQEQLTEDIIEHLNQIQSTIDNLSTASTSVQQTITRILQEQVQQFEIKDSKFVASQDLRKRIINIEEKFENVLRSKTYTNAVTDYLSSFTTIADSTISLHKNYNDLEVELNQLSSARRLVYGQANEALRNSRIKLIYLEPVKHMLMQQVTTGGTISDMEKIIQRWHDGGLSAGSKSPTGKPIPNLTQYTTQLARDTSYQFNGTINDIIRDEYSLDGIIYTGDIIQDSRPLCVYLVKLERPISQEELQTILKRRDLMPGRIPGTTSQNFCTYRGGFSCRHMSFPVRIKREKVKVPDSPKPEPFTKTSIQRLSKKNVSFTVNGRENDETVIQILNNKFKNFNPETLINEMDLIGDKYGIKWDDRSFNFKSDISPNGTIMNFENSGQYQGEGLVMNRRFYLKEGKLDGVYHSLFSIPNKLQGKNLAKELFTSLLDQYKAMGLKEITVTANIDIGGYAWANYGFEAKDKSEVLSIFGKLKSKVVRSNGKYSYVDNKGNKTIITNKEVDRIQSIIAKHYEKYPNAPFPMNQLSRRKSGKALLLGSFWSGKLDLTKKRKLSIFEDYLKNK
jgi:hypothetical protein